MSSCKIKSSENVSGKEYLDLRQKPKRDEKVKSRWHNEKIEVDNVITIIYEQYV